MIRLYTSQEMSPDIYLLPSSRNISETLNLAGQLELANHAVKRATDILRQTGDVDYFLRHMRVAEGSIDGLAQGTASEIALDNIHRPEYANKPLKITDWFLVEEFLKRGADIPEKVFEDDWSNTAWYMLTQLASEPPRKASLEGWFNDTDVQSLWDARVIVMAGYSGSGKSHVARAIAENFDGIILRSDVIRDFFSPGTGYVERTTGDYVAKKARVYDYIRQTAIKLVRSGYQVILDATHLMNDERAATLAYLDANGLLDKSAMVHVDADHEIVMQRQRSRSGRANEDESWEEAVARIRLGFNDKIAVGEASLPKDNEGFQIIRVCNNFPA